MLSKEHGISEAEAETQRVADSGITKIGEPEDVANLVAYIVSPQNRYLHGALDRFGRRYDKNDVIQSAPASIARTHIDDLGAEPSRSPLKHGR
jgi:hypothetical protein